MSDSITLTINGQQVEAQAGRLLIDVADENDIVVPRFCYHKKLSVAANCRMCLVEIERSPKPMPACATHVAEGMVVKTQSQSAIAAQKSTMEFLLINHPLDCPICDQGGECELQDVAMGFGQGVSKYTEQKRVVMDKNIGPLIATDFTRCIHCTRCVRFGDEIAGLPEMGATGRGEHVEIGTYIEKAISSELSGNVIDICPVGALTAKPSRYTARPWELTQHSIVSPHDCVGSNIYAHTRGNQVIRIVPRENESINEAWISDRDRFSYTSLSHESRLLKPMVREGGQRKEIDWETALNLAVEKLSVTANRDGGQIAALVSPQATLEEQYLAQKLIRGLGSNNIDHRLTQVDFTAQKLDPVMPWLGRSLESIDSLDSCLLVAASLRQEQPMLSHRLRKSVVSNSAQVSLLGHVAGQYNFPLHQEICGSATQLISDLCSVAVALSTKTGTDLPERLQKVLKNCKPTGAHEAIAESLCEGADSAVIVGIQALSNPDLALVQELCEAISDQSNSTLGYLSSSANSAGACLSGCRPDREAAGKAIDGSGQDVQQILTENHQVLLTLGIDPTVDLAQGPLADQLNERNDFIIAVNCFDNEFTRDQADLVLPLSCFTESSGTYVNVEGLWQSFNGCVKSAGDSRQGWKILAALGQVLLPGAFEYADSTGVRNEVKELCRELDLDNMCGVQSAKTSLPKSTAALQQVTMTPIYASDELARLSQPLQNTPAMKSQCAVAISSALADKLELKDADQVRVKQGVNEAVLSLLVDDGVPDDCVYVPRGIEIVKTLGGVYGAVELEKVQ